VARSARPTRPAVEADARPSAPCASWSALFFHEGFEVTAPLLDLAGDAVKLVPQFPNPQHQSVHVGPDLIWPVPPAVGHFFLMIGQRKFLSARPFKPAPGFRSGQVVMRPEPVSRYERRGPEQLMAHFPHSHRSFALASAVVCHCMLLGLSAPPLHNGTMWSRT
jgi:hypothetical protein